MDRYKLHRTLYDVTITSMTAGQQLVLDANMSANVNGTATSFRTSNPTVPNTSDITGQFVAEIDSIEVIPPITSSGTPVYGPIDVSFLQDGIGTRHWVDIPCDAVVLGWPLHKRVANGAHRAHLLGTPFWKLALQALGHPGKTVTNMPVHNSTLKFTQTLGAIVNSVTGWTAAPGYGLRIIVKGYLYDADDLAFLAPGWQTAINLQTEGRDVLNQPALTPTFGLDASALDFQSWAQMPGGSRQQPFKIAPYVKYALTATATTPNERFALSNYSITYGASNHVTNQYQDLGINGPGGSTALWLPSYGVTSVTRPSNLARVGWIIDGTEVPQNPNSSFAGFGVSDNVNDWFVGDIGPYLGDEGTGTGYAGKYEPIPHVPGEPLLLYGDIAAPFVADNGTAIPAGAVCFQEQGVIFEGVS
jgi:hypothetical protein